MNSPLRPAPIARKSIERLEGLATHSKTMGMDLLYLNRAYSAAPAAAPIAEIPGFSEAPARNIRSVRSANRVRSPRSGESTAHPDETCNRNFPRRRPHFKDARKAAPAMVTSASSTPLPIVAAPSFFDSKVEGDTLEAIRADIGDCTRCRLHLTRTKIVFGSGNRQSTIDVHRRRPRARRSLSGEPFVGRAANSLPK